MKVRSFPKPLNNLIMKNMKVTRKEKGIGQYELEDLTGIKQTAISSMENGRFRPNKVTREKVESVLGKIDWNETSKLRLRSATYFEAERLVNKLIGMTVAMDNEEDRKVIIQLIHKYFK